VPSVEVASLQGFKVILGNYSPQLNIFHLMTLRPNNLITQQVERMRNLNYLFSGAKLNIFF